MFFWILFYVNLDFVLSFYLFLVSSIFLILYNKHMLMILISLEFLMVSLIYYLFLMVMNLNLDIYVMLIVMVVMVCEGALGIALMIFMVRLEGNDYLFSLNLMKW